MTTPFATRVRLLFRRAPHCAECGCEIARSDAVFHRGQYYCGECGYELVERVKASTTRRPLL